MKQIFIAVAMIGISGCSATYLAPLDQLKSMRARDYFSSGPQLNLAEASARGNVQKIDEQIRLGADPNHVGNEEMTPLMWSLAKENKTGFKKLLELGANPNFKTRARSKNDQGRSVMMIAAIAKDPEYLKIALAHKGDPNAPSWVPSWTVVFDAVRNQRLENIKSLAAYGADINRKDSLGATPIINAAYAGQFEIVYLLLSLGANPKIKENSGSDLRDILFKFEDRGADMAGQRFQKAWYQKVLEEMKRRNLM